VVVTNTDLTKALIDACVPFTAEELKAARRSASAEEGAYRRGYAHGYEQALADMKLTAQRGYGRPDEISSILDRFLHRVLRQWRAGERTWQEPPQFRHSLPPTWASVRAEVFARDGHECVLCGTRDDLQCDHILEVRNGGLPDLNNLRTLCGPCHRSRA
jgi:5-methylcytosine-specific restriction endonuclease McrA